MIFSPIEADHYEIPTRHGTEYHVALFGSGGEKVELVFDTASLSRILHRLSSIPVEHSAASAFAIS